MKVLATALVALTAAFAAAAPALAQTWQGLVVGQTGAGAPRAFGDSFRVAEALKLGGIDKVELLRDRSGADIRAALEALSAEELAVVYVTGPLTADGKGVVLAQDVLRFTDIVTTLGNGATTQAVLLIEACPVGGARLQMPAPSVDLPMLRAASAAPGTECAAGAPRLTDVLIEPVETARTLNEMLQPVWFSSDLTEPLILQPVSIDAPAPQITTPVVSIVESDVVSLAPVSLAPVTAAGSEPLVTQAAFDAPAPQAAGGEVVIFAPTSNAQLAALPTAAGLPEPSIIVGLISQPNGAEFEQVSAPGEVTSNEISYEDLEARRALRRSDPEGFASLVDAGAFDPPSQLLAAALQTELSRMRCYTAGIDGIWGGGSRRSVERYFDQIDGSTAVSLEPTTGLFRQIITKDDVECPVVAAAPRAQPRQSTTTTRTTTRRATTSTPRRTTTAQPRRTPRQQPAQQPRRTISSGNSLGVFR